MKIVDAIQGWIDDSIEILDDDEIDAILDIVDAIVESEYFLLPASALTSESAESIADIFKDADQCALAWDVLGETRHWIEQNNVVSKVDQAARKASSELSASDTVSTLDSDDLVSSEPEEDAYIPLFARLEEDSPTLASRSDQHETKPLKQLSETANPPHFGSALSTLKELDQTLAASIEPTSEPAAEEITKEETSPAEQVETLVSANASEEKRADDNTDSSAAKESQNQLEVDEEIPLGWLFADFESEVTKSDTQEVAAIETDTKTTGASKDETFTPITPNTSTATKDDTKHPDLLEDFEAILPPSASGTKRSQSLSDSSVPNTATESDIELFDHNDGLGPAFFEPSATTTTATETANPTTDSSFYKRLFAITLISTLFALVILGGFRMVGSLRGDQNAIATGSTSSEQNSSSGQISSNAAGSTNSSTVNDEHANAAVSNPNISPATPITGSKTDAALLLHDGTVAWLAMSTGAAPQIVYSNEQDPAVFLVESDLGLTATTSLGNLMHIALNEDGSFDKPEKIWDGESLEPATMAVELNDRFLAVDLEGNVSAFPTDTKATEENLLLVWAAEENDGEKVISLNAHKNTTAAVTDRGNIYLFELAITEDRHQFGTRKLWDASSNPPAALATIDETGVAFGVQGGGVAKLILNEPNEDTPDAPTVIFEALWDPSEGDPVAVGYASSGDTAVIVLNNGDAVLVKRDAEPETVWSAEETLVPALIGTGDAEQIMLILDSGSVLRLPTSGGGLSSPWDTTDPSLALATQVVLLHRDQ